MIAARVAVFARCRRLFIKNVASLFLTDKILHDFALEEIGEFFGNSQLFIPRKLLHDPLIIQDVRLLGLRDCLGRSIALQEYDAELEGVGATISKDPYDHVGRTLLHAACLRCDEDLVDTLVAKGLICATKTDSGLSPLHIAAIQGHLQIFGKLHAYYAKLDDFNEIMSKVDQSGRTFFEWAASCGHHHIIQFSLMADIERMGTVVTAWLSENNIMTAIKLALQYDHSIVLRTLISYLGDNYMDEQGRTPMWYAAHYKRLDATRLLTYHANSDHADKRGRTPLMEAAQIGFLEGVERLLRSNLYSAKQVSIWSRDSGGKTAKDLAEENGHQECVQVLLDWEAQLGL
ncbi:hypothetical protein SLS60_007697 [Paraconiothyrium brasiliense]|uniref:Ankyrin repeat protein n=1 Tax=Paraconiothyrium brasiliense TaxID=300254 RepID=A0ABR3R7D7_9PLEO